jgi:hypothetical protein
MVLASNIKIRISREDFRGYGLSKASQRFLIRESKNIYNSPKMPWENLNARYSILIFAALFFSFFFNKEKELPKCNCASGGVGPEVIKN